MPDKRRLVTSKVCFGSEKAVPLDYSYNKFAYKRALGRTILITFYGQRHCF